MDAYCAYRIVRERVSAAGYESTEVEEEIFKDIWNGSEEDLADFPMRQGHDPNVSLELLLLVLTKRLLQSVKPDAFVMGYEVACPAISMRFVVFRGKIMVSRTTEPVTEAATA